MPLFSKLPLWVSQRNMTSDIEKAHVFCEILCLHKMATLAFPSQALRWSGITRLKQQALWDKQAKPCCLSAFKAPFAYQPQALSLRLERKPLTVYPALFSQRMNLEIPTGANHSNTRISSAGSIPLVVLHNGYLSIPSDESKRWL